MIIIMMIIIIIIIIIIVSSTLLWCCWIAYAILDDCYMNLTSALCIVYWVNAVVGEELVHGVQMLVVLAVVLEVHGA